jgi:hypothetical protein
VTPQCGANARIGRVELIRRLFFLKTPLHQQRSSGITFLADVVMRPFASSNVIPEKLNVTLA